MKKQVFGVLVILLFSILANSAAVMAEETDEEILRCLDACPIGCSAPEFRICASNGERYCNTCAIECYGLTEADDEICNEDRTSDDSNDDILEADSEDSDNNEDEAEDDFERNARERIRSTEKVRSEFAREVITEDGARVKIEREIESENNKVKIKIKKTIVYANGTKMIIEMEMERNENGITREIKIKGDNIAIDEELEIDDLFEGNESELRAVLSDGKTTRLRVLPEEARETVRERLRIRNENISNITLEEIRYRNIPRVVYNVEANQNGRFLGVFKLRLRTETQIDPETGELIAENRPWWAFMVSVPNEETDDTEEEEDNEVCCKLSSAVFNETLGDAETITNYMLLDKSECVNEDEEGNLVVGRISEVVDDSFCSSASGTFEEGSIINESDEENAAA